MGIKFKIVSMLSFVALAIVLTFVGVWAIADLDFVVGGNITYTAPKPLFSQDENGFYVTMGTYDGNGVVWRLIGIDGKQFAGSTCPTAGTCTFLLETFACSAITSILGENANYTTDGYNISTLRSFIKDEYLSLLDISANNEIYSLITPVAFGGEEDKLWCLSKEEFLAMVRGPTDGGNGVAPSENLSWGFTRYWSRTLGSSSGQFSAFADGSSMPVLSYSTTIENSVRPAFNIVL